MSIYRDQQLFRCRMKNCKLSLFKRNIFLEMSTAVDLICLFLEKFKIQFHVKDISRTIETVPNRSKPYRTIKKTGGILEANFCFVKNMLFIVTIVFNYMHNRLSIALWKLWQFKNMMNGCFCLFLIYPRILRNFLFLI